MRTLSLLFLASLVCTNQIFAQEPTARRNETPQASTDKRCLAVKDAGSHAFRNIMLAGVAGALISKKQYEVVDAVNYPAKPRQKFHGGDLQTLQVGGTRIVILDKNYTSDDLHLACR